MSSAPAVSVLMTSYNREAYIAAAIESVLAQRFTDFELIVVDDASADRSARIAEEYAACDSRIRVYRNPLNVGDYPNRNVAAQYARGRYLKYHDSDDVMYPHCLELMVTLLEAEPRAGFALSTGAAWPGAPVPLLSTPRQSYEREFMGFGLFMCGPGCALFRADVFRALGGWPTDGAHSDALFLMKALAHVPVLLLPADLFWYRTHPGQELASARARRDYARLAGAVWRMLASDECPLDHAERTLARRAHTWSVAKHTWRDIRAGEVALAAYRLAHSGMTVIDFLRYFRRPARTAHAGVAFRPDSENFIPEWARWRRDAR